jgi:hypothetical protein
MSAALALTAAALAPTAAFAKGPGAGAADCSGDCTNDAAQVQQQVRAQDGTGDQAQTRTRAREESAQVTGTRANAGGGQQVQANAGKGGNGGRGSADAVRNQAGQNVGGNQGAGRGPNEDMLQGPGNCDESDVEMGTLTADDEAGLLYMVNEEKLAHDVYVEFAKLYDLRTFERIALSEARHQAAVRTVLERYQISDPTAALAEGEFSDPDLQQLYADLIAQGSVSLEDALAAAILIEKTDIADLQARMAGMDETAPDVFDMYSHLLAASGQHQAAFERQL